MGPFEAIGSFSDWKNWAHLRLSAVSLTGRNGPIQGNQQFLQLAEMGPFEAIGSFSDWRKRAHLRLSAVSLVGRSGPIQGHWQFL
jgi:hypothetical protein